MDERTDVLAELLLPRPTHFSDVGDYKHYALSAWVNLAADISSAVTGEQCRHEGGVTRLVEWSWFRNDQCNTSTE